MGLSDIEIIVLALAFFVLIAIKRKISKLVFRIVLLAIIAGCLYWGFTQFNSGAFENLR